VKLEKVRKSEREREWEWKNLEAGGLAMLVYVHGEYAERLRQWICYALRISQKYHWNALHKAWGDALCIWSTLSLQPRLCVCVCTRHFSCFLCCMKYYYVFCNLVWVSALFHGCYVDYPSISSPVRCFCVHVVGSSDAFTIT
jgi:hypothetical protein